MTERIGLQAVLEMGDFTAGVNAYDSGISAMESANEGMASSGEDVTTSLAAVDEAASTTGKSAVELAAQMEIVEKAYGAIKTVVGEAIELAELGAQAERAEKRFTAFANEIGNADDLLAAFQRGAGGTVDKMTAMSSAAKLLQMGLVKTDDEMETVVEIATRLGDQTATAGDRVADFALLLANQSIPRLDNFGISSGKVRDRIEELIKTGQAAGREDAFKMAVFEEGAKSLDILGERTVDAGAKMEKARAKIADLKVEFAQGLLPVVASVFEFVGNLNSGTLALIATLGSGAGAAIKFSGGLGGLAEKLGASTMQMGLMAAAVVGLVMAVEAFQDSMSDMAAAQDTAQAAAASLGDQVRELMDDGMSLGDAIAQVGGKVNQATSEFNNATVLGVIPLKNALNAGSEFSKTMEEATSSLQGAIIANTDGFSAYVEQVAAYNAGIEDSAGKLTILSEAEYNMATIRAEGASAASALSDEILKERYALEEVERATGNASSAFDAHNRGLDNSAVSTGAATEAAARLVEARQQANNMTAKAAAIEDMQAASALASAAAMEAKRQKDIETVQAEQQLAQSVMNASDAMIAQTFIQGLDPEKMGLTAYRAAVENIQLAFGLATPESIALARGINQGIDAANEGKVSYKELDTFISDLITDSKDGAVTFDNYASAMQDSESAADALATKSSMLGEDLSALSGDATIAAEGMDGATESTRELEAAMEETAGAAPGYGSAIGSGLRAGMEPQMDGFVASFRAKLQSLRDQLPSSEPKDTTSPLYGLGGSGEAIINNLTDGIDFAGQNAVNAMANVGEAMGQALADAVGDNTEDLFSAAGVLGGLGSTAAGIFQTRTVDPLQAQLDALGGSAASAREEYEANAAALVEVQKRFGGQREIERIQFLFAHDRAALTEDELQNAILWNQLAHDRLNINNRIVAIDAEMVTLGDELVEQQERLARLQQQQENLKFLEQQAALLELIAEHGLDAGAVLGGLELGLDADVGDVVDAMSAAMELIIAQAEEELGIASPSKVFEKIGAETMSGMALGIERLMSLPVAQSAIAAQEMIAAPAAVVAPRNNYVDNSRTVGPISIEGRGSGGQMGDAQLVSLIRQVVNDAVRGR